MSAPGSLHSSSHDVIRALYVDHNGWLQNWLRRRLGCAARAADLSHDVYVRLLGREALPPMAEPRAYLARIAHGLVIDHYRREAVERAWLETLAALPQEDAPSPEQHVAIVDALARLDALLAGLKPRVRQVFTLSRLEELSYPAIAAQLGVSLSTVEKDMALALRHCYQVMLG